MGENGRGKEKGGEKEMDVEEEEAVPRTKKVASSFAIGSFVAVASHSDIGPFYIAKVVKNDPLVVHFFGTYSAQTMNVDVLRRAHFLAAWEDMKDKKQFYSSTRRSSCAAM